MWSTYFGLTPYKEIFSHSSSVQCSGRRLFKRHLAPASPETQAPLSPKLLLHSHSVLIFKNFPHEGLAYKGILLFLTCEQAKLSAVQFIHLFSIYSSVSLEFEISFCERARINKVLSVILLSNSLIQVFRQNAFIFLLFWTFGPFWKLIHSNTRRWYPPND